MLLSIFSFWSIISLSTIFNNHWLLTLFVIHRIHRYIICKIFINVDFILVPYCMIHDIIYWDLIISIISSTWGSSTTESLIMSNESFEIFTFSTRSSCILIAFLIQEFLSLEPIILPRFKHVFGTNKSTTFKVCYELISNILGTLAFGIYDLITLSIIKNIW